MGEQVLKGEDWLPEGLPEGWKVEIRVRKTGKKDRYYTDPEHGYIFRSIKDIDRYLLTGKLGRHVTKTKPTESSSGPVNVEQDELTDVIEEVSQKQEVINSDGMKESCIGLEAHGEKAGENAPKRKASAKTQDSKGATKRKISRPTKKKESTPFFIIDSDHCDESDAIDIPNISELIDSMHKEKEGHKTVYISAPAIGSLLRQQTPETGVTPKLDYNTKSHFGFNISQHISNTPNTPYYMPSMMPKREWESKNIVMPHYQNASPFEKLGRFGTESRPIDVPGSPLFGNLLTDPCIDFAFKTLTGTTAPVKSETGIQFSPQQFGSSRMFS